MVGVKKMAKCRYHLRTFTCANCSKVANEGVYNSIKGKSTFFICKNCLGRCGICENSKATTYDVKTVIRVNLGKNLAGIVMDFA